MSESARYDTAHANWDKRWQSADGRADWLAAEPDVTALAKALRARGSERALDLGCGVGRHAIALAQMGFQVAALDGSGSGIAFAREQAAIRGLHPGFHVGLMTALPYADDSFDYVLSINVIYHGDRPIVEKTAGEIRRVLRAGGVYQGTMLSKRNTGYGVGTEVAPDTFVDGEAGGDKSHPHFYCDAAGLVALFAGFELMELKDIEHRKPGSWHWHMSAELRC